MSRYESSSFSSIEEDEKSIEEEKKVKESITMIKKLKESKNAHESKDTTKNSIELNKTFKEDEPKPQNMSKQAGSVKQPSKSESSSYESSSSSPKETVKEAKTASEAEETHMDLDLDEDDKEEIIEQLLELESSENILKEIGPRKRNSCLEFLRQETIIKEIEDASELEQIVAANLSHIQSWLRRRQSGDDSDNDSNESGQSEEEAESSNDDQNQPKDRVFSDFKKLLLSPFKELQQNGLGDFLANKELEELKEYLKKLFEKRPKYLELLETKLELMLKKFDSLGKKDKKKAKKKIEKEFKKLFKKDSGMAIDYFERFDLQNSQLELPQKLKLICSYPENLREQIKQKEFLDFAMLLDERTGQFKFEPSPRKIFEKCLVQNDIDQEFLGLSKKTREDFDEIDFWTHLTNLQSAPAHSFLRVFAEIFFCGKTLDLEEFNQVNQSKSLEEGKALFKNLARPGPPNLAEEDAPEEAEKDDKEEEKGDSEIQDDEEGFVAQVLNFLIGNIKRSENLDHLKNFLSKVDWLSGQMPFLNPRFFVTLFLSISDLAVRLRAQLNLSKVFALPLTFHDPRFLLRKETWFRDVNFPLASVVMDSHSALNLNLGHSAKTDSKFERLLNKLFFCKFETSESLLFRRGCVDVNFDHNSDNPRGMSFLTVYGRTEDTSQLRLLAPLLNLVILQISAFDLAKTNNSSELDLIREICAFAGQNKMRVILIVRDFTKKIEKVSKESKKILKQVGVGADQLQVLCFKEKDFHKQKISDFGDLVSKAVNDEFVALEQEPPKMTKKAFRTHVLGGQEQTRWEHLREALEQNPEDALDKKLKSILDRRMTERENFAKSLEEVDEFCEKIDGLIKENQFTEKFMFNRLFLKRRNKISELRDLQHKKEKKEQAEDLEQEIAEINLQIKTREPSQPIKDFHALVMSENYAVVLMLIVERLRHMNSVSQDPVFDEISKLKKQKDESTNTNQKAELDQQIKELYSKSLGSAVSLEVLFRNLFPYLGENRTWLEESGRDHLKNRIIDLLLGGFSLELVDGENLEFKPSFFIDFMSRIGTSNVCTVGCMGPQSSGKSTLLNYMFGTLFHTSQGRCTSGLYMSIQRIRDPESQIKYLIIVDSEGLHSAERSDPEYDRKICSFILNNIDLLLVNVKGEMKSSMTRDLEITLFTANKLKSFKKVPEIYFVFNQSNVKDPETKNRLFRQVKNMNENILKGVNQTKTSLAMPKEILKFDLQQKYLVALGTAFEEETHEKNRERGHYRELNFKRSSRKFGQEVSELSGHVLKFVREIPPESNIKNFGRFFATSSQKWRIIEKFTDLTKMADIETMNKMFEIKEFIEELKVDFYSEFDGNVEKFEKEMEEQIEAVKETEKLKNDILVECENKQNKLERKIEHWKSKVNREIRTAKLSLDLSEDFVNKAIEGLKMKVISFKINIRSKINLKRFSLYEKSGPEEIILEAEKLRHHPNFKQLDSAAKQENVREKFENVFAAFIKKFSEDSEMDTLEEFQYKLIHEMATKLNSLIPVERAIYSAEEVSVEACLKLLVHKIEKEEMISVTEEKLRNLNQDFQQRISASKQNYFDFGDCFRVSAKVEFVDQVKLRFRAKQFGKFLQERFEGIDAQEKSRVEELFVLKDLLVKYGVSFDFASQDEFTQKVANCENVETLVEELVATATFEEKKIESIDEKSRNYFEIQSKTVTEEEFSEMSSFVYLKKLNNDAKLGEANMDASTRDQIELFIDPFDNENQAKVMRAMTFMVCKFFNFDKLVRDIRAICMRVVFNSGSPENPEAVDYENVSQVSQEVLSRIILQELQAKFGEIDRELDVCAAELSDQMVGFLVYLAMLFVWKFTVNSIKAKHRKKFKKLELKKEEFRVIFTDTSLNNKEEQIMIFVNKEMGDQVEKEVQAATKGAQEHAQDFFSSAEVQNKYSSREIGRLLSEKLLQETTPEMYEHTRQFLVNPNQVYDDHIRQLNKQIFEDQMKTYTAQKTAQVHGRFKQTLTVLGIFKKFFLEAVAESGSSVLPFFSLFKGEICVENEIKEYSEKKVHLDELATFAFDLVLGVLENEKLECERKLENSEVISRFVIPQEKLDSLNHEMKFQKAFEEFRDNENEASLCPTLATILKQFKSKKPGRIYNFKSFITKIENNLTSKLKELENSPFTREILEIEDLFQKCQIRAKGCPVQCKFCHKKCDHEGIEEHLHHANHTGHQPRIFSGGFIQKNGKKIPSKITCDLVDKHREIEVNGIKRKWQEIIESTGNSNWKIESGKEMETFAGQLNMYEHVWKVHGPRISEEFKVEDDGCSIRQFIEDFNRNLKEVPTHYVLAIDESGSMRRDNSFENAIEAVSKFVLYLKSNIDPKRCYITFILFDNKCRVLFDRIPLSEIHDIKVKMRGGGTDFNKMLSRCISSIDSLQQAVDQTRIMVYTDGVARFPELPLKVLQQKIIQEKMDLKLHWFSAVKVYLKNPGNVFIRSQNLLGKENCTIDEKVKATHALGKFIEVFNYDK